MTPIEKSIFEYFREFAADAPHKRFLFDETRSFTAEQAFDACIILGNRFHSLGMVSGTTVALRCTRSLDTCLIYLALQMLGVTTMMTDSHQNAADFLRQAEARADFTITNEDAAGGISANGNWQIAGVGPLEIPTPGQTQEIRFSTATDLHAPATVIFTSGSTGKGKGVLLSQYNLINHIRNFSVSGCYRQDDVSAEMLPIHHVFGLAVILMGLVMRYCILFPRAVTVDYAAACIEEHKITRLDGVPSFALALAEHHKATGFRADSLRVGVLGGAPSTKAQFDFIESELGIQLLPVYGQSECIGITGANETQSDIVRSSTVGGFLPMNRGYILDDGGNDVPQGTEGEICVKGPAVMLGYLNDEAATLEAIDPNGILHTGDLGYLDEAGNLHISGRKKDIIIRNGNNISARTIEDALHSLEGIARAAVVGVKHEKWGEVPCALVVRSDPELSSQEIMDKLAGILAKNELPAEIRFADALPLTSSGKPDKQKIKALF